LWRSFILEEETLPETLAEGGSMGEGLDYLKEKRRRRLSQKKHRKKEEYRKHGKNKREGWYGESQDLRPQRPGFDQF